MTNLDYRARRGDVRMNPLKWERPHQVALIIAIAVGSALGTVLGYFVFIAGGVAYSFEAYIRDWWIGPYSRMYVPIWTIFGALVGAAAIYVRRLTSR